MGCVFTSVNRFVEGVKGLLYLGVIADWEAVGVKGGGGGGEIEGERGVSTKERTPECEFRFGREGRDFERGEIGDRSEERVAEDQVRPTQFKPSSEAGICLKPSVNQYLRGKYEAQILKKGIRRISHEIAQKRSLETLILFFWQYVRISCHPLIRCTTS